MGENYRDFSASADEEIFAKREQRPVSGSGIVLTVLLVLACWSVAALLQVLFGGGK